MVNDNVPMQYDFRSIYATILEKWFCLDKAVVQSLFPQDVNTQLQTLPLLKASACTGVTPPPVSTSDLQITNFPNPFTSKTTIQFSTAGGHTLIQIFDTLGRLVKILTDKEYVAGTYRLDFDSDLLPTGLYYARLQNGITQQVRAMVKVR
jgi:hypothetical protein